MFEAASVKLIPVPADVNGLNISKEVKSGAKARLVYTTPSHQFPLGTTMSVARRLELVNWAAESGARIPEDDYDSEFRYTSRPLPALQSLDQTGSAIYLGTFSKVLFPALRLGACAHFISSVSKSSLKPRAEMDGALDIQRPDAGMHVVARLSPGVDDVAVARAATSLGVSSMPLSSCYLRPPKASGLTAPRLCRLRIAANPLGHAKVIRRVRQANQQQEFWEWTSAFVALAMRGASFAVTGALGYKRPILFHWRSSE